MATPSKKLVLIFVGSVFIVIGFAYATFNLTGKETYVATTLEATTTNSALLAKDGDSDGLKDWEEQLWKTDPYNPDTDGDGTGDGQEIKLGRNPVLAGPNDKFDSETIGNKINAETDRDLSDTDKFSRELFVKIIGAGQATAPPTEADFQNFLNNTVRNEINAQKIKTRAAGDFNVDIKETPETIKAYGNAIAAILQKKPPENLEDEIDIVSRADATKDPAELKKLDGNIAAYNRLERALLELAVPQSALPTHIAFTNATASMIWSITGLKYILTDPIKALPGVAGYAENSQNFYASAKAFKVYLDGKNVTFNPGDDGYGFFDAL